MLGPPAAQTCPGAAPAAARQRAPRPAAPRVAALSTRMRLGYDGRRPATAKLVFSLTRPLLGAPLGGPSPRGSSLRRYDEGTWAQADGW